jgi:hypothetical protein
MMVARGETTAAAALELEGDDGRLGWVGRLRPNVLGARWATQREK